MSVIRYLYYDMYWLCFWAWRLSTERVAAQPSIYIFPPGVNVLATIEELILCILVCDSIRWCKCTLELSPQTLEYVIHS